MMMMMQPADFSLTFSLSIDGWERGVAISVIITAMSHCLFACDIPVLCVSQAANERRFEHLSNTPTRVK
jgi:hypothetical protein